LIDVADLVCYKETQNP